MRNQTLGHDIQTESVALKLIEHDKPISFNGYSSLIAMNEKNVSNIFECQIQMSMAFQ